MHINKTLSEMQLESNKLTEKTKEWRKAQKAKLLMLTNYAQELESQESALSLKKLVIQKQIAKDRLQIEMLKDYRV